MRQRTDTKAWYRQFWPWFIISIPAATVVACIYFISLAVSTADPMVEGDYYKQGLAINESLAEQQLSATLGISASIRLEQGSHLVPSLDSTQGSAVIASMQFQHPFDDELDFHLPARSGTSVPLPPGVPISGRWYIELQGDSELGRWQLKTEHDFRNGATARFHP